MQNVVIVLIVACIMIGCIAYLVRAKKRGETCVGCPYAKQCASKSDCGGSCSSSK